MENLITSKPTQTMAHAEQWRVTSDNYKNTFDSKEPANRVYGVICKEIEEEGEGYVLLEYRPASKNEKGEKWIELKEFELISTEDEDEEDDEEEQD
jgi:hypothetical protein